MSIKDDIAAGPKFEPELMTWDNQGVPMAAAAYKPCGACGDSAHRDVETGLCAPCWRAWRFGGYESPAWKDANKRLEALEGYEP